LFRELTRLAIVDRVPRVDAVPVVEYRPRTDDDRQHVTGWSSEVAGWSDERPQVGTAADISDPTAAAEVTVVTVIGGVGAAGLVAAPAAGEIADTVSAATLQIADVVVLAGLAVLLTAGSDAGVAGGGLLAAVLLGSSVAAP